jgi:xanthine dehydrogenase accessory factor
MRPCWPMLAVRIEAGQLVRREVDLAGGRGAIIDACRGEALHWDGQRLATFTAPTGAC